MKRVQVGICGALGCLSLAGSIWAASNIGFASTRRCMTIESATVRGNGDQLAGASVETQQAAGMIELERGTRTLLGQHSEAAFFGDRAQLRRVGIQLKSGSVYSAAVGGIRFQQGVGSAAKRIAIESSNRVLAAALNGPVQVMGQNGSLITSLMAGSYFHAQQSEPWSARGAA